MIASILIGVLGAAALVPQTDTILARQGATRLELENFRGTAVVRTWDRDEIRIRADHPDSRSIDIHRSSRYVEISVDVERGLGLAGSVDFELTVPRDLDVNLEGMALDVDVRELDGKLEVNTIHGRIGVLGGRGAIFLESVNGEIVVEGAQGPVQAEGVAGGVTLRNCSGDIQAESVGGSVVLEGITSGNVEAGSVGGTLSYQGNIRDGGTYTFGTHGGGITLVLPPGINARMDLVTLAGNIRVDYPGAPSEPPARSRTVPGLREKRLTFELGNGSASIEVESFGGVIEVRRVGGGE